MTNIEWIIYEQSTRWVAALRTYFHRRPSLQPPLRIVETRRLSDITSRLHTQPARVVLLEVDRDHLPRLLEWLAETAPKYPDVRFATLLDQNLTNTPQQHDTVAFALREAGACEVATSPRHLDSIVALAHGQSNSSTSDAKNDTLPLRDWAWARLPWQADPRRVG